MFVCNLLVCHVCCHDIYRSVWLLPVCVGVETIHPVGSMSDYEKEIMAAMKPELIASIEKGIKFVQENP